MRHVILTCSNHPELRWSCKEIAVTDGKYNFSRTLFFNGFSTGRMYGDGSGLKCTGEKLTDNGMVYAAECDCPAENLILAPEDNLVKREYETLEQWRARVPRNELKP